MKMNRISRILALFMALVMVLCTFIGCAKKAPEQVQEDAQEEIQEEVVEEVPETIIGKWQAKIDCAEMMKESLEGDETTEMFASADFSGITMLLFMEFNEDGTYSLNLDKASGEDAMKQMASRMIPVFKEYLRQEYASAVSVDPSEVTDEELDSLLPSIGVESWDGLADMMMQEIDTDEMFSEANKAGKYLLKDDKLYTTDSVDEEATEQSEVDLYELSGNSLKIHSQSEDVTSFLKELNFTRVE